jgi:uncharacterized protein (TIGR02391 family)
MRWDDIEILRAVDRHQGEYGRELWSVNGMQLMNDIAGESVADDQRHRGFVRELLNLRDAGYLAFRLNTMAGMVPPTPNSNPHYWLQQVSHFALTTAGQDRARGRVVIQPVPDPSEDDGRPISRLILKQVAAAIQEEYGPDQIPEFLRESGVSRERVPGAESVAADDVFGILVALDTWGSEGRRTLRGFLGRWLDDQLISGPSEETRASIVDQLARQGWYVEGDRLVIGAPAAGRRVSSPVLRDARLHALHPEIAAVAEPYVRSGHRGTAVFEALKVLTTRLKRVTGLDVDGTELVGKAFTGNAPLVVFADLTTETGRNVHNGVQLLFRGAVQAIRNPSAHELASNLDENETFELLALASMLMRRIERATGTAGSP